MEAASRLSAKLDPAKRYAQPNRPAKRAGGEQKASKLAAPVLEPAEQSMGVTLLPPPTPSLTAASPLAHVAKRQAQPNGESAKSK